MEFQTLFVLPDGSEIATIKATVISATAIINSLINSIELILVLFRNGQVRWLHQRKHSCSSQNDSYHKCCDDGSRVVAHGVVLSAIRLAECKGM